MTQEEKARAYDEALKKARFYHGNCPSEPERKKLEGMFPVLRESEDERIRQKLIEIVGYFRSRGIDHQLCEKFITYLEKQKENIEKEYVFRPLAGTDITIAAEQAIRRAEEGDRLVLAFNGAYIPVRKGCTTNKIVDIYDSFIEKLKESHYTKRNALFDKCVENCDPEVMKKVSDEVDEILEKEQKPINWTELTWKDINYLEDLMAKVHYEFRNGIGAESFGKEVLEKFREYKGDDYLDEKEQKSIPLMNGDADLYFDNWFQQMGQVTSRQCFEEGIKYAQRLRQEQKIDINKLRKDLYQSGYNDGYQHGKEDGQKEQKPVEWSEEDEKMLNEIITIMDGGEVTSGTYLSEYAAWLKSLPKRFNLQPKQEWSEEDQKIYDDIISALEKSLNANRCYFTSNDIIFLKSLRPSWKPSEEQMKALKLARSFVVDDFSENPTLSEILKTLQEQLEKLM